MNKIKNIDMHVHLDAKLFPDLIDAVASSGVKLKSADPVVQFITHKTPILVNLNSLAQLKVTKK